MRLKTPSREASQASFAVGEQVEAGSQDLLEEPRTEAAAVEDDGDAAGAQPGAYLLQDVW